MLWLILALCTGLFWLILLLCVLSYFYKHYRLVMDENESPRLEVAQITINGTRLLNGGPNEKGKILSMQNNQLVMEENEKKEQEAMINTQLKNNESKYHNGNTIESRKRIFTKEDSREQRNLTLTAENVSDITTNNRGSSGDYVDTAATLPDRTKLTPCEKQNQSHPVEANIIQQEHKELNVGEQQEGGEDSTQNLLQLNGEVNGLSKELVYVKLPPESQCDKPCKNCIKVEKITQEKPSKNDENKELLNNNKDSTEDKDENPCLVDCLYYSLQCCECSIM